MGKRSKNSSIKNSNSISSNDDDNISNKSNIVIKRASKKDGSKYDLSKLIFDKSDIIGEGTYSRVYKFRYSSSKIDPNYVVKKIKVNTLRKYYGKNADKIMTSLFIKEIKALISLSRLGITPKIYGIYTDIKHNKMYYVLQRLDVSLGYLLRHNLFKLEYTSLFIELLDKLMKTPYRHTDLHIDNVMFNFKSSKFFLIDFGKHKKLVKQDSQDYFYTNNDTNTNNKDFGLFDKTKSLSHRLLGSSGYSAIATIYKRLLKDVNGYESLLKLKKFLKKMLSNKDYDEVINYLENS